MSPIDAEDASPKWEDPSLSNISPTAECAADSISLPRILSFSSSVAHITYTFLLLGQTLLDLW